MTPASSPPGVGRAWTAADLRDVTPLLDAEGCTHRADEPLARHTSMGTGGPTPLMIWPRHPDAVVAITAWMAGRGLPWRCLGGGTNVMVGEAGVAEVVLSLTALTDGPRIDGDGAWLPAGVPTALALRRTVESGLDGLAWAAGLPGTVGGAAAGNAGCWGSDMARSVTELDVVTAAGEHRRVAGGDLGWSYRHVDLEARLGAGTVIVAVGVRLREADPAGLRRRVDELQRVKRQRQPLGARNAGCIFRNPAPDRPAGRLIDEAGCKGLRVGDAEVSALHGNFIVNRGGATATDVDELIRQVKEAVSRRHGVELHEEIRRW